MRRTLFGLTLSSAATNGSDSSRHVPPHRDGGTRDEAELMAHWESRCARTLPARSGRLADEPARILGPIGRGRAE